MTNETMTALGAALAEAGYTVTNATLDGTPALVGRSSSFRWRWMATRLHTFVVVAAFDPVPEDAAPLDRFLELAVKHAAANKGGMPAGFQTGTAAIAVALVDGASTAAREWALRPHGRKFGHIAYPVLADMETGEVVHPPRMIVGGIYNAHLKGIAERVVKPALSQS
ncbi:MAG TPA: hypothetical protein VH063_03415 [Gaiellaceae bacterium]|nr:hypothetical protein [Gaiellaceae bacterium]